MCVLYISLLVLFLFPCGLQVAQTGQVFSIRYRLATVYHGIFSLSLSLLQFSLSFSPCTLSSILSLFRLALSFGVPIRELDDDFTKTPKINRRFRRTHWSSHPNCSMVTRFCQLWTVQIQRKRKVKGQRRATFNSASPPVIRDFTRTAQCPSFLIDHLKILHNVNY